MSVPAIPLPPLLLARDGSAVRDAAQWRAHRPWVQARCIPLAYGAWPAEPRNTRCVLLHSAPVQRLGGARLSTCRIETDGRHAFLLRLFLPAGAAAHATVLSGDGCWHHASDAVIDALLHSGYAFAQFNRVEVAPDKPGPPGAVGALAAWAWAYHRAVDALAQCEGVDATRIAVVGHSRGGKAALLAGATDERIALTSANNSGAGGAGCFRGRWPGAETLAEVTQAFPHWFGPALAGFAGREEDLPFDQHFLKALVAPRALLTTEARDDLWANPVGSWHTHRAAQEVYAVLGARERVAIRYRRGGHDHALEDWLALRDFCDVVFRGASTADFAQRHSHQP